MKWRIVAKVLGAALAAFVLGLQAGCAARGLDAGLTAEQIEVLGAELSKPSE